jgi:hypothetical protein
MDLFLVHGFVTNSQHEAPRTTIHLALTLSSVWHGWLYQELSLPPTYLSVSLALYRHSRDKTVVLDEVLRIPVLFYLRASLFFDVISI